MKLKTYSAKKIKSGIRVLMRVDLNVPLSNGKVKKEGTDRIKAIVPEVKTLQEKGAKVVLMSHLGRPGGKRVRGMSLQPVARKFAKVCGSTVRFSGETVGPKPEGMVERMGEGQMLLLENTRFYEGEKSNKAAFAKKLAKLGDVYINDAFSVCHRKHASVAAVAKYVDSYAGKLVQREVKELSAPLNSPFVLLMGGIKLKTKIDVLEHLAPKADATLIGGGIAATLLRVSTGVNVKLGTRPIEPEELALAERVMKKMSGKLVLPVDARVSKARSPRKLSVKSIRNLEKGDKIYDIGPETEELFRRVLIGSAAVVWNGPMGYTEKKFARNGTKKVAKTIADLENARTVVGGGDTIAFLQKSRLKKKMDFASSGGGAMLTFLAGKPMPGLEPLKK